MWRCSAREGSLTVINLQRIMTQLYRLLKLQPILFFYSLKECMVTFPNSHPPRLQQQQQEQAAAFSSK